MTAINVQSHLTYEVALPTSFAFSVVAARTNRQSVSDERIDVTPEAELSLVTYDSDTRQLLRLAAEPGRLELSYRARVVVDPRTTDPASLAEVPFAEIPADVMPYLNPSRYCESDKLGDFAARHFGYLQPGHDRVQSISNWVNGNLLYAPGSTDATSSTTDVLLQRAGVCRDFAHVAISLCRALGIPARYVSGYGVGVEPQDFHGFFEAYLGGDWYLFDPTGMTSGTGLVRVGSGRDAADAPFATLVGQAMLVDKVVEVTVEDPTVEDPTDGPIEGDSIATSIA